MNQSYLSLLQYELLSVVTNTNSPYSINNGPTNASIIPFIESLVILRERRKWLQTTASLQDDSTVIKSVMKQEQRTSY